MPDDLRVSSDSAAEYPAPRMLNDNVRLRLYGTEGVWKEWIGRR